MDKQEPDWAELITRALLQQTGRQPTPADMERLIAELRIARDDPEAAGLGRQLRAMGLAQLDGQDTVAFMRQVIDLTLKRLEEMGVAPAESAAPATTGGGRRTTPNPELVLVTTAARSLLEPFLVPGADHASLAKQLRPRPEDYAIVFEQAYAGVAQEAYERIWDGMDPVPRPNAGQRDLLLAAATSDSIRDQGAPRAFPGGFSMVRHTMRPGLVWLCWKFVKPGSRLGMAFDGLVRVDDHWAWFPKSWRVLGNIDA